MISKIYYFSGTGNSLAVARKINEKLTEKSEMIPVPVVDGSRQITADRVGFVFPVYFHKLPDILTQLIRPMEFTSSPYIYAVVTHNGEPGQSLFDLKKLLEKKGQSLSLGCAIAMPGNALVTEPDIAQERLAASEQRVEQVSCLIERQEKGIMDGENGFMEHIRSGMIRFIGHCYVFHPKKFKVEKHCTGCGTCKRVCPLGNIRMVDHRPEWGKNCASCLACFHWCPKKAVYMNNSYVGKRSNYHHPEVGVKDMIH